MQLKELYDYKNQLFEDMLTDKNIVRLIDSEIDLEDAKELAYSRVFPYEYVPETIQEGATYVCIDVDLKRFTDRTFYTPIIYVWVFTHKSNLRMPHGGVRTDTLCSEICDKLNGSRKYGLGELHLNSISRFAPMTDFQGKVMSFIAKDFSKMHGGPIDLPDNRKEKHRR